ncbi:MAG: hypothetical protein KAJ52_04130 [Sedimentisphaerales bacterium]|nr:hypothetical protein [Sedimentisphaerales bacterium]
MGSGKLVIAIGLVSLVLTGSALGAEPVGPVKTSENVSDRNLPPVRAVTSGPKHHWFAYYDKWQFDPTDRFLLGMEVDFEHRSVKANDVIKVGMIDLQDNDRWIELGETRAWCWQQGCMLQWRPGSMSEVLWNDRQGDSFVCHILDVFTKKKRTILHAVYTVSPDGRTAVAPDFRRVSDVRPAYGYRGLSDPYVNELSPKDTGIFRIDMETGEQKLIISIDQIAKLGSIPNNQEGIKHYFNHLLFGPDGKRFIFLHRWRYPKGNRLTRMLTAAPDGSDIRIIDDNGYTSHFIWRDPKHILAESKQSPHGQGFYLFEDGGSRSIEIVGRNVILRGGHCTYLPGNKWILSDTYPDKQRMQHVFLYNIAANTNTFIGHFHSPKVYSSEWRVDTHPRFSRDGRSVVVDSPHGGNGRQLYLIDISGIINK